MPSSESTPLIGNGQSSLTHNLTTFRAPTGHPTLASSFYWLVTTSYLNVLLVFIPLGIVAEKLQWPAVWIFSLNFLAIIPLAKLLGDATEQAALKLGPTLGGLLNATFGNAVELIVGIVALIQGQLRIVQTSLVGSILSNILLVLGCSFICGGIHYAESNFQQTAAQASGSIMMLSVVAVALPAAYQGNLTGASEDGKAQDGVLFISRGTSIVLLTVYVVYLFFQLRTHSFLFEGEGGSGGDGGESGEDEEEQPEMTPTAAVIALGLITLITSFSADYLVGAIDETARDYNIPKAFISTILLPVIGNAAEHVTSCVMAYKGKMEIAIGVSVGSSIQISMGLLPALVIVAWIIGQPLTLFFQTFETVLLISAVVLANSLIQDGKSNYMEGFMLMSLYLIAALSFWVTP